MPSPKQHLMTSHWRTICTLRSIMAALGILFYSAIAAHVFDVAVGYQEREASIQEAQDHC